jgi:hypothetical protein
LSPPVPLPGDERYAALRSDRERGESEEEPRRRRGNGSILPLTREQIERMKKKA